MPQTTRKKTAFKAVIKERNVDIVNSLVRQLRSPLGVIPFVGAGMSAAIRFPDVPPGFPQWADLLNKMAAGTTKAAKVLQLVDEGKFELAAQALDQRRPGVLPLRIRDAFDREVDRSQLVSGALSYIPALANGPVITTNFDRVLEQVFEAAGKRLQPVHGPRPDEIVNAIHQNERALLKIHGDCCDRTFRVLTLDEYNQAYGVCNSRKSPKGAASIGNMARLMFTNRPLLFLGCSLESDRTTDVLRALRTELPGLTHYAILAAHRSLHRWEQRQRNLDKMGVRALWYAPGEFGEIELLLRELLDRSSTRKLRRIKRVPSDKKKSKYKTDKAQIIKAFGNLRHVIKRKPIDATPGDVLEAVRETLFEGKLAFFLGSQANLGNLPMGDAFYERLAKKFKCPMLGGDRGAVAAFITSRYGADALWREIRAILSPRRPRLSAVHQFLAALPRLMRATRRRQAAPLWIFTTNYDTVMEHALTAAGESFHLLYYAGGTATEYDGLFFERFADGLIRVIERPENLRYLDPPTNVIVKLNGGIVRDGSFPESVSIAPGHFERFAATIPNSLPLYLRTALREKSLLFFGHGLAEPDVQALVRFSAPADRTIKSWAIQKPPKRTSTWRSSWEERVEHLKHWGLQVVSSDLRVFLAGLHKEISNRVK